MKARRISVLGAMSIALMATPLAAQTSQYASRANTTLDYQVRKGDTLIDLAQAYFTRPSDYRQVQRLNRVTQPRRLQIGRTLSLPVNLLKTEPDTAVLSNFRGDVQIGSGQNRQPARLGQYVPEGAIVTTSANAFARLALSDGGHVVVPSNSRVRISRLRRYLINGAVDHALTIENGRLETRVAPRQRPGGFVVGTPVSVSAVRGTEFRVAFNEVGATSATEVLEGSVSVETSKGSSGDIAGANEALAVTTTGLSRLPLLPAPARDAPRAIITAPIARVGIAPLSGAVAYRGRLATDAGMVDAFAETDSRIGETQLDFGDLADGAYYLRLTALSEQGIEGQATVYSLLRVRSDLGNLSAGPLNDSLRAIRFKWEVPASQTLEDDAPPYYRFILFREGEDGEPDGAPLVDRPGLTDASYNLSTLPAGVYGWRVQSSRHKFGHLIETWSDSQQLRIGR